MITCYSNNNRSSVIPCRFSWYKIKNGITTALNTVKGSSYLCDPSDVGAIIKAEISVIIFF
jgi:hypothetical protein